MDAKAKKLFRDFESETIGRVEVSKKRTHGNVAEIDDTFAYISSQSDDKTHYFGNLKLKDKKLPCKNSQPVFYKLIPKTEEEHVALTNRLDRIKMTMDQFLPPRARKLAAGAAAQR